MQQARFKLRKWKTSDAEVMRHINKCEGNETDGLTEEMVNVNKDKSKVLGIIWDEEKDCLEIEMDKMANECSSRSQSVTKRSILSSLAKLFDPLGIVSPVALIAKLLFQQLCQDGVGWDDELPKEKTDSWEEWIKDLKQVKGISIPRCLHNPGDGNAKYTLHGFGDASTKAYCAVIYLVCETPTTRYSRLICSKTRVAPLKSLTIPRLELMSARILATLMETVRNALSS